MPTAAANSWGGPQGFFDALFGGGTIVNPGGDGAPSGTYHTVCVRACDGFYFPISYSTVPSRFADDTRSCQRLCPAAEAELYSFRNPGENMEQAVSVSGQAYTALDRPQAATEVFQRGIAVAEARGDLQTAKEMQVFLRRLQKPAP